MQNEEDVLRDVAARLDSIGVPYMLTGSMAMNYYAEPRMTRDLDIVVELREEQIDRLEAAFKKDYYLSRDAIVAAIRSESMFNLVNNETIIKVDFIVRKDRPFRLLEWKRRRQFPVNGASLWIVSREDLVLSKLEWARDSESEMQFRDIKNLLKCDCDLNYLNDWAEKLGLNELWNKVKP